MLTTTLPNGVKLFLIDDVSPEDMAMLMALYARSPASVAGQVGKVYDARRAALHKALGTLPNDPQETPQYNAWARSRVDAIMQVVNDNHPTVRATRLHDKYVAGYGHKSIADCGATALFVEGGSMILAKALEDTPLFNGQEMSSRAVDCGELTYADPLGTAASREILEAWRAFYKRAMPRVRDEIRKKHPRREDEDEAQYERAVAMRAFDVCRGFLPFGCATQTGWAGTLRHIGDRLAALVEHPAAEVRDVAQGLLTMCRDRYPSSGFDATPTATGEGFSAGDVARAALRLWSAQAARAYTYPPETDGLQDRTAPIGDNLFCESELHFRELHGVAELLRTRPRGALLPHSMASFGLVHFDFPLDMGSWRDIQRHRALLCRPALLTAAHGFEPWYLDQLPEELRSEAEVFVVHQAAAIECLTQDPVVRQYYLGMGFRVRTRISAGLPALVYMLELRSGKSIHPTLRRRVLEMANHMQRMYPEIALHVDRSLDDWTVRRGAHVITERQT